MKKLILPLFTISIIWLFASCRHCIEGSDVIITEDRTNQIRYFDEIESNGDFNIIIIQDSINEVIIDGDNNIVPYISTYVSGSRLVLEYKTNKCFQDHETTTITVRCSDLTRLNLNGSGNINCDELFVEDDIKINLAGSGNISIYNIDAKDVNAKISGSGDIYLTGDAVYSEYYISGSGLIKAFRLQVDESDAIITGSGNIYVSFYDFLNVDISGSGNVYFKGDDRRIDATITGSGDIIDNN